MHKNISIQNKTGFKLTHVCSVSTSGTRAVLFGSKNSRNYEKYSCWTNDMTLTDLMKSGFSITCHLTQAHAHTVDDSLSNG